MISFIEKKSPAYLLNILFALAIWGGWGLYTYPDSYLVIENDWQVTVTMIFGSFIAGATSEGGGAIAFPVFTKLLHISPKDAQVFSLAIQSVGMVAASVAILMMRVKVLWEVIAWVSFGGIFGFIIGSIALTNLLAASFIRMLFTVMAVSLAVTMIYLNSGLRLRNINMPEMTRNEVVILFTVGVSGGMISALVGSGIDMLCFTVLVLLFRICEGIATPTSVIIMAIHSVFGICMQLFVFDGVNEQVRAYWLAAVPVVVVGAPLGAYLCSRMQSLHISYLLIALILLELCSSLWILSFDTKLIFFSVSLLFLFSSIMIWMSKTKTYIHQID